MALRRSALAASALALSAALACGSMAWAAERKAAISGEDIPAELREAIVDAIGEVEGPPGSRLEARRRANAAGVDAKAVLESWGYYDHLVEPNVIDDEPGRPVVKITPGPRSRIVVPLITWIGTAPPPDIQQGAERAMNLPEGTPGMAVDVIGAQGRILTFLQQSGYADATAEREVIVDHDILAVIPEYKITSGALVRLGGIDLRTEGRTNPAWVRKLGPWAEGEVYDPKDVAELDRRLHDVQTYESVTVALGPPDSAQDGLRPIVVSLADRAPQTLDLGVDYSSTDGAGFDARLQRFNRLGRADTQTFILQYGHIQSKLDAQIALPHWRIADRTLTIGSGLYDNRTDAYDSTGGNIRADVTRHYSKTTYRTFGITLDSETIDERFPVVRTRQVNSLTGLAAWALDRSNDPLNPTRGWRVDGRIEPTYAAGAASPIYVRAVAQGSLYLPLGERARTVVAGRLKIGSISGGLVADVPASQRFYSGGGGSIRGYSYQGVGPTFANNLPAGGLGLFESSIEVRQQFTQKWGGVVFADVGSVSLEETPDFSHTSAGVGFGVRYDLGFGPIRADLAIPLSRHRGDPAFQVYLSVGQSF